MKSLLLAGGMILGAVVSAEACPDFNQWGESYQATGEQLYTRRDFNVVAGGENYIWDCPSIKPGTDQGAGYFPTAPDFTFELSKMAGYQLVISVVSACDSALLINTASVNWYYDDDDNGDLDPKIVLTRPADGYLDVWVGTFDGEYCDAIVSLETFK
ncbi:MAG TPA: hypothetical protein VLA27_08390 [Paracoccaceae bacterium]|nr:hypothetical protein [Paracoccaceae bacterium]